MAKSETFDLAAGQYLKWKEISLHANKKATSAWAQKILGTHEKYTVDGDWLDKSTIDGSTHFDTNELAVGDYIKVSGASHSNKKHAYWRVDALDSDAITVTRVDEVDVLEAMKADEGGGGGAGDMSDLRHEVARLVSECDDRTRLADVRDHLRVEDD